MKMEVKPILVEIAPDEWKEVSYRRVFTLVLKLHAEEMLIDAKEADWQLVFTTSGAKRYEAWHKDGEYKNCKVDGNGYIRVWFFPNKLEVGEMYCEMRFVSNLEEGYADYIRFATGVRLVSGCGLNAMNFDIDVELPYVNVGLNTETLWEELSKSDDTKVIDKSHLPTISQKDVEGLPIALDKLNERDKVITEELTRINEDLEDAVLLEPLSEKEITDAIAEAESETENE